MHLGRVERQAHQHRRHARPRRLRRRGRAHPEHGRWRGAPRGCRRRPDAADQVRHLEGAGPRAPAHRGAEQGRQARCRARPRAERGLRPLRQPRRVRRPARLPRPLCLRPLRLGGRTARRAAQGSVGPVRARAAPCPGAEAARGARGAVPHARHHSLGRPVHRPHPDGPRRGGYGQGRRHAEGAVAHRRPDRAVPRVEGAGLPRPVADPHRSGRGPATS